MNQRGLDGFQTLLYDQHEVIEFEANGEHLQQSLSVSTTVSAKTEKQMYVGKHKIQISFRSIMNQRKQLSFHIITDH